MRDQKTVVEWPTLFLLIATYTVWAVGTSVLYAVSPLLGIVLTGIAIGQYSSLQHEVLHSHPFQSKRLNEALVFPAMTLTVPYGRFRDTHLAHHYDPNLTDPYDDPESNFVDPAVWRRLPGIARMILFLNNTLLGRMLLGPIIGAAFFIREDARLILKGDASVIKSWAWHVPGLALVAGWLWVAAMPWWAYLFAVWLGHGLLRIRTFLEHRAHDNARARTVIIEDRGPLSILFLNNNFHAVHHMHPTVPWYRLPATYAARQAHFQRRNDGYVYRSYGQIFRRYLFKAKDPVAHPIWPVNKGSGQSTKRRAGAGIVEERNAANLRVPAE